MPDDTTYGTSGNDTLSGDNGKDTIHGLDGDDIISGGNGVDNLFGDEGNDQLYGDNGSDNLTGGAGDDLIDGLSGFDTAYFSGPIGEYSFFYAAGYLHVVHLGGTGADGYDRLIRVERLVFANRVIDIGSGANAPVAGDDHVFIDEDAGTHGSGAASVLDNDFDFDGDALTVTGGTFTGTYGTLTLNSDGTYSYTLFASAQELALGENVTDSFDYTVSDNDGTDTGTLVFHIAGVNDAPTANPDSAGAGENQVILVDVLANDDDVDNGAVLAVTAASAPPGQGTASVVGGQVQFDPGSDFDHLASGESVDVVVSYTIEDEHGATDSSTLTVTVTGANDGPVANPDSATTSENATILIDVVANDTDVDNGAVLTVTAASAPSGQGAATVVGNQVEFDPGPDFDHLAVGDSVEVTLEYTIEDEHGASAQSTIAVTVTGTNDGPVANPDTATTSESAVAFIDVLNNDTDADDGAILIVTAASAPAGQGTATVDGNLVRFDPGSDFDYLASGESVDVLVSYSIEDEHGAPSSSTVTVTVTGRDEGSNTTGTEGDDTLTGTPGDDTIDALGGDDTVFGQAGDDLILGGAGFDQLYGEGDNDDIDGGGDGDVLVGGDGDDQLSGGDGFDTMLGEGGNDTVEGGNDNDFMLGGEGNDELLGQAGDDTLDGESGDDSLDGGDGDDSLSDFSGVNSLAGGLGSDFIAAGSADGAQAIDGGDGNDTIRHYGRQFASTIATGSGSDTIELLQADVGTAAIVVTDFTAGAGGDMLQLSGGGDALLSLLSGWDGSSNPFGSGFLRLTQSGADTLLEWDQDGTAGGPVWETLIVFQNTTAGDFTEANFTPAFNPDGSDPAGETITGTEDDDTLTGTIGADTIDALGGNDFVSGGSGGDLIDGGDGFDILLGEGGNDTVEGGNDNDFMLGGEGNDDLLGQAGDDTLDGESGDDSVDGGDGNDFVSGGDGDDGLDGGDGDDFLTGDSGSDVLTGGLGADIFHFRTAAQGPDEITDFTVGIDKIYINAGGFGGGLAAGGAVPLVSGTDPTVSEDTGQFLYDTDDGTLLWDADGTGGGGAVLIGTFTNFPSLTASDFVLI